MSVWFGTSVLTVGCLYSDRTARRWLSLSLAFCSLSFFLSLRLFSVYPLAFLSSPLSLFVSPELLRD